MLIGSGVRPPSGGREGEKGKGGRGEGTCPGGPWRAAHPLPSLLPPLGPRNPTGNPSLCLFFLLFLFRLNRSSAAARRRLCAFSSFHFHPLSPILCRNVLRFTQKFIVFSCVRSHFKNAPFFKVSHFVLKLYLPFASAKWQSRCIRHRRMQSRRSFNDKERERGERRERKICHSL
jgi:hypothetical protein